MKFDPSKFDPANIFDFHLAWDYLPFILSGLPMTIIITLIGMAIGLVLGLLLAAASNSKNWILRVSARLYISVMRSIPILVLLFILYFGLPMLGLEFTALVAACLGFGLASAAFIAEINRAAFNSIDAGQWEACRALNMSYVQTMRKVILPQAVRTALPPLGNVIIDMLKATSLAAVITIPELFQKAQMVAGRTYDTMTVYILAALIYYVLILLISFAQERLEKHYSKFL